jgi:hypothetical protein
MPLAGTTDGGGPSAKGGDMTTHKKTLTTLAHVGAALGLAGLALIAVPATADAAATSTQDVIVDDLETELTTNPCTGDPYLFTRHFDGRVHMVTTDGRTHFEATIKADDATFTPLAPGLPTFTGTEQVHTSETTTSTRATVAFGLKADVTSADGQRVRFSEVEHVTFDAEHGTVEFEHPVVTCR